jgi:ATP-dependent DNA helicase DinG
MNLEVRVAEALGPAGPLSKHLPGYRPREAQLAMAEAVARTLSQGGALAVEAGTGVGKTFAYLAPALLSGERALISTATKALQDQLYVRDIPQLCGLLGLSPRVALLKGRSSYLCLHRMGEARQAAELPDKALTELAQIELWAHATSSGDLAELSHLDEGSPLLPLVSSTRENCLGARCPQANICHVNQARRQAMAAELVVVNHHLFFADLQVRDSGVAELLPTVRTVVFDEAHQLNEVGVQFLGTQFSTGQIGRLAADLGRQTLQHARGFGPWAACIAELEQSVTLLSDALLRHGLQGKLEFSQLGQIPGTAHESADGWQQGLQKMHAALMQSHHFLLPVAELAPDLNALCERAAMLATALQLFLEPAPVGHVRWAEAGPRQLRLVQSPLNIAQAMQTRVLGDLALAKGQGAGTGKSWVFTSATLGHDAQLSWFVQSCGLEGATVLRVHSPFHYATQAALYVPPDIPRPQTPGHSEAVAELALHGARILGGRTLVLTTTLRALREVSAALQRELHSGERIDVLEQGKLPKRVLLERMALAAEQGQRACVLVASASFWEGIDLSGTALQLLVIDKLPFAAPDDPLQHARDQQARAEGRNPFRSLHLPQAAVALRQGAGRLIRRETDRGVLVVCDTRLLQMAYGRTLLKALPPMRQLLDYGDYTQALRQITTVSTRDPLESSAPW